MQVNVSAIVHATRQEPTRFSASVAETGLANIGQRTYRNACEQDEFKLTDEELQAWLDYVPEYGAWSWHEIKSWSRDEATGLFVQFVSGDLRTLETLLEEQGCTLDVHSEEQFRAATENEGGSLYKGDDGEWYYWVGC